MRQLRTVRKTLTTDSAKTLVHALIATRLDYCNSVFHQISAANLHALQSFLNAAARLVMRKRKYDHITATLRDNLHWLPIRQRGNVQTVHHRPQMPTRSSSTIPVRTVYTSLHQRWTSFPAFSNIRRSARAKDVNINIRTSSFAVSGSSVWNKLPATLRVSPTLGQFQSKLKAVLFCSAYETQLGAFVTA